MPNMEYFLGANSPQGFTSLYDQLIHPELARAIYILKGGPGCGKSTLMSRVALRAEQLGMDTQRILCSGDPDSLDGVVLPQLGVALVDGTAPHVVEPKHPGALEHYVNLGTCYDAAALAPLLPRLRACMQDYQPCYRQAYHALAAAAQLTEDGRAILLTDRLRARLQKRARGILDRERPRGRPARPGRVSQRFLSAVTHKGPMTLYHTALAQCERIYELRDSHAMAHELLAPLLAGFAEAGCDVVACPDPMFPQRLEHLLVPQLSLAFLSCPPAASLGQTPYRRVRLDAMADPELVRQSRPRLRLSRRVSQALMEDAVACLGRAKAMHDELEALYRPHTDFCRADEIGRELMERIFP